jgi:redox-sensitive bicupin YhaK (pirin superfamily)
MKTKTEPRIIIRKPESIYQIQGAIVNGTFQGRWHFSFGDNYDPEHMQFGTLRVFNDDTLSLPVRCGRFIRTVK